MVDAVQDEAGLDPRSDGESLYEDVPDGTDPAPYNYLILMRAILISVSLIEIEIVCILS